MRVDILTRATRFRSFRVSGAAETVFPLFCPVRETEWVESWDPGHVYSVSGVAERGCVFTTSDENGPSTWIITEHDARAREIVLIKFTPEFTVCELAISVAAVSDRESEVSVTYSYTALGEAGTRFVEGFTEELYTQTMSQWQAALNQFLTNGPLSGAARFAAGAPGRAPSITGD